LVPIPAGVIDPGLVILAVTYGLNINMLQAWVIWNLCNVENKIISVERLLQYATIPSEPPLVIESNQPDRSWPLRGKVDIHDLLYAPHMPLVLRGIMCTLPGGMKTGIMGGTGSGKSTLIQTLFRIVDPASGLILIDGIDISSIGLHDLRSRLSIIPQDLTMFAGTALDKCQLGDEVRRKEGKLDSTGLFYGYPKIEGIYDALDSILRHGNSLVYVHMVAAVSENGENWSMGQRQLVYLGRVLLKKSKVLVLV
ncbi:PREDICTED: ABC transporter, partial [Prunus dulcis]